MRQLWADYRRAYADCSAWLAAHLPPWGWVIRLVRDLADVRRDPPKET